MITQPGREYPRLSEICEKATYLVPKIRALEVCRLSHRQSPEFAEQHGEAYNAFINSTGEVVIMASTMSFLANNPKRTAKGKRAAVRKSPVAKAKSPINRARMEQALKSGETTHIPHGLSTEEMRQFILNAG